jgi:cobalt-zinc-cadmium efflux system protein
LAHDHSHAVKNIRSAFWLNLGFAIIELIGGFYTNSVAIISDAVHDLGDSLSLGAAWYFQKLSHKSSNKDYTYGYRRFNVLGALLNAIVLSVGSVLILSETIPRLFQPEMADAEGMLYLAILGVVVNGIAALRLSKGHSLNEKVVYLHLLEDVLGWVATLVVAIVLQIRAIPILDPLLSLAIATFILINVFKNLKKSVRIILQTTPTDIDIAKIQHLLLSYPEIKELHDCHIWTMDGEYHILSTHLVTAKRFEMDQLAEIKKKIKLALKEHQIDHATLEFEMIEESCH